MMNSPDFVIAGAPRCGTTSLSNYLAASSGVFFSPIKEPNYFCLDTPRLRVIESPEAYVRLFSGARPGQLRGEGSTAYLFSQMALSALLEHNPKVRIIVSVRNPLEMVVSHYSQKVYAFEEEERDFARAWALSAARAEGRAVGKGCRAPRYLDYRAIGRLGEQIQRAKRLVPEDQLHIIVFADLQADPAAVYRSTLGFLGLDQEDRLEFPVVNARHEHIIPMLGRVLMHPPPLLQEAKRRVRQIFPAQAKAVGRALHGLNRRAAPKSRLSPELRDEMIAAFKDDVSLLSSLLGRDLSHWLMPAPNWSRQSSSAKLDS
jgi:hypothetical protein